MSGWICAFRGRRDDYQVPLALMEAGRLDRLITDVYAGTGLLTLARYLPETWREKVLFRHKSGLPAAKVACLWGATLREHLRHRLGASYADTFARLDPAYSEAAALRARRTKADLLLYSPYAWEAFTASYAHHPRRMLFQFHPHAPYETSVLQRDAALYPEVAYSFAQETGIGLPEAARRRVNDCWQHADKILCASTFTRQTLLEAGAAPAHCVVVPYGIETPPPPDPQEHAEPRIDTFNALFVGSGVQRKGLHHLLRAWERAELPEHSSLTLVCRVLDPGLRERVQSTPGVRWLAGVSRLDLAKLYRGSTLFVMPSLIEGFGQVYLEALSQGCPVLGTANTCLPDLGRAQDGIFLAEVANVDDLSHQLSVLSRTLPAQPRLRDNARAVAAKFTWPAFRKQVVAQL